MTSFYLQIVTQTDRNRLIAVNQVLEPSNCLLFPVGWIQLFKLIAISIQI